MQIRYGTNSNSIDVTEICNQVLSKNGQIVIPSGDSNRAVHFTDPVHGKLKSIFITTSTGTTKEYPHNTPIYINTLSEEVDTSCSFNSLTDPLARLNHIHSILRIRNGSFNEELPEQRMAATYLTGRERVLEIGGNIGRNSLIIAYILAQNNSSDLVTLESDPGIATQLTDNRDLNGLKFKIENSALSSRKLIQRGWDTIPSDVVLPGYISVNTISYNQLVDKYNINFDTLVLDCEGAFYYILMDMPEILENVNLIIMENDYHDITHKNFVDSVLQKNSFTVAYSEAGGWGPCVSKFFEVWKKQWLE